MTIGFRDAIRSRRIGKSADDIATAKLADYGLLREELDLHSMDFLSFVTALDEHLHVSIPEAAYEKVGTLDGCVAYLVAAGASA